MDEVYDVIDKEGGKIGKATWTEVHAEGLLHQTVAVLIFKDKTRKEILLQKRNAGMKQHPNLLQHSAGGHVLAGDTLDNAIRKEIQEELFSNHSLPDLEIKKVKTFFTTDISQNNEMMNLFEAIYPGPFYYDKKELAEEPRWIRVDELIEDISARPQQYTPNFRRIIKEYFNC